MNSTSLWSRNGTRGSIETDMPILSTRISSSSGRRSLNSRVDHPRQDVGAGRARVERDRRSERTTSKLSGRAKDSGSSPLAQLRPGRRSGSSRRAVDEPALARLREHHRPAPERLAVAARAIDDVEIPVVPVDEPRAGRRATAATARARGPRQARKGRPVAPVHLEVRHVAPVAAELLVRALADLHDRRAAVAHAASRRSRAGCRPSRRSARPASRRATAGTRSSPSRRSGSRGDRSRTSAPTRRAYCSSLRCSWSREADRERAHRPVDMPRHQRHVGRGVDAAREKHAERHVRHQPLLDRRVEQLAHRRDSELAERRARDSRASSRGVGAAAGQRVPVAAPPRSRRRRRRHVAAGRQLVDAAEHRQRRGRRQEATGSGRRRRSRYPRGTSGCASSALISEAKTKPPAASR